MNNQIVVANHEDGRRIVVSNHVDGRRKVKEAFMVSVVRDHKGPNGIEDLVISQEWAANLDEVAKWTKYFTEVAFAA